MTGQDLHKYYKILDVTPDTPWEDIKRTYHDMMKVWHPDRFAGDSRLQKIVEEKTKELTYAFKIIEEDYHSIKFYNDPLDEVEEAPIKAKPRTDRPEDKKPKPSRHALKQEAEEWLKKARAIDTGNYRMVVDLLNKAIELDPFLEDAYIERGEAHAMLRNHIQALEDFNEAITLNSKSFGGFRGRANAYSELSNPSQAIMDYTSALELEPVNYPELYYLRGACREKLGNRDEAKEDFKNAKVLKILSSQSHSSHPDSELVDDVLFENGRRTSFKQVGLHVAAIVFVLAGIVLLALPVFLSKDDETAESRKERMKDIDLPVSASHLLKKAVPVTAPLPISDHEDASGTSKKRSFDDAPSMRQSEKTKLTIVHNDGEKTVRQGPHKAIPSEQEGPSVQKEQRHLQGENNDQTFKKITDQNKKEQVQIVSEGKRTAAEKNLESEETKFRQLEKLKALEKEFPFEMIKRR